MELFRSLMTRLSDDPYEEIKRGTPTGEVYYQAVKSYQTLVNWDQASLFQKWSERLQKKKPSSQHIQALLLLDYLLAVTRPPTLLKELPVDDLPEPHPSQAAAKKQAIAEAKFVNIYKKFLNYQLALFNSGINIRKSSLEDCIKYCYAAAEGVEVILKNDFVLEYLASNSSIEIKEVIYLSCDSILKRVSANMSELVEFVVRESPKILQSCFSVQINAIYEKVLRISSRVTKLEYLNRVVKSSHKFPRYQVDKILNKTIEKEMLEADKSKKALKSMKELTEFPIAEEDSKQIELQTAELLLSPDDEVESSYTRDRPFI